MFADYYAHMYFNDPKADTDTVEDDDFNPDDVEALINAKNPNDWETLK